MADSKLTSLATNTAPLGTDLAYIVDDPTGTAASQKVTFANLGKGLDAGVIPNTPAGDIAATNVQAAIDELDTEKLSTIAGLAPDTQNTYARTQYLMPYASSTTAMGEVAIGTATQVLTSNGAGAAPTFQAAGGGGFEQLASDPGSPSLGDSWFNTTDNLFKGVVLGSGTWSSGGALATARYRLAGCGTQSAGLSFGGWISAVTEEYNGTSWSAGGALATASGKLAGCGTQAAGLSFGGYNGGILAVTEEYNGTSWSSGGNLGTAMYEFAGCGTQSSGLSFGGTGPTAATEEYNGTSWSAGGNLGTARFGLAGCGTQSAGLSFGGNDVAATAVTEEYNGTSWSSGGALATARYQLAGCGTQSSGLSFGGNSSSAVTEGYNGTSWSSGGALATGRNDLAGCGTQSSGLSFGGTGPTAVTEEYTAPATAKTFTLT